MKMLIGTSVIIILIIGFSFYGVLFLEETSLGMINLLDMVEESVKSNNWESAEKELNTFTKEWEQLHFMWAILIEHSEIDNIDIRLAYLKSYIETKSKVKACAEINALFTYLEHIPQIEKLTIQNIL